MGNIFSGETEDFLLYIVLPLLCVVLVVGIAGFETLLRERLRVHAPSWLSTMLPSEEHSVHYRAPASTTPAPTAPRSVQWLARCLGLWCILICASWVLVGATLSQVQLLLPIVGIVAALPVARVTLALCDRNADEIHHRIQTARTFVLVHHAVFALLVTGLLGLFILSNQFFWNSPDDGRSEQLVQFVSAYLLVVIPTSAVGAVLASWLKSVRAFYPLTPKESAAHAT